MVQRFSEVPDQLGMAILSVIPGNPLLWTFFNEKFQFGDCKNVNYFRKSVVSESGTFESLFIQQPRYNGSLGRGRIFAISGINFIREGLS